MTTFTVFFCGTGSNNQDSLPKGEAPPENKAERKAAKAKVIYHAGELISTLGQNHAGMEFVDWAIIDGPGSGNIQED